jgi:hypothetical protein
MIFFPLSANIALVVSFRERTLASTLNMFRLRTKRLLGSILLPSLPEVIHRLVEFGLKAKGK